MQYTNGMQVIVALFFTILTTLSFFSPSVDAVTNGPMIECDSCGYCANRTAPENWGSCAECLYGHLGVTKESDPKSNKTLLINLAQGSTNFNKPPQPAAGKYFTQLGCLNTGLESFRDPSSAGGVLNFLLNNLIFPTVGTLAFGTILYGAFQLSTAQGDQMKIQQGRRLVTSSIVGLVFTLSAILIVNVVGSDILKIPGLGGRTAQSDLPQIKTAIDKLAADTGKIPGGLDKKICRHDDEIYLNEPLAGLLVNSGVAFPNWDGPYATISQLTDPRGGYYWFDPDYYCRPDVEGCKDLRYSGTSDGLSQKKQVRAILYVGPDGDPDYCLNGISQCSDPTARPDLDNVVLVLCE